MTRRGLVALCFALLGGCVNGALVADRVVGPEVVLSVRWRRHLVEEPLLEYKPQEFARAASDGQRVWIGASPGRFFAFSAQDGTLLWSHDLSGAVAGEPLYHAASRTVYVGTVGGVLYALDADRGTERWRYTLRGPIESKPVVAGDMVFFTSGENRVYAVDAHTGKWKWQYDRESPESFTIRGTPGPLFHAGRLYVGFSDGYLACLSAATGEVAWARSLAGDATTFMDVDSTPVLDEGTLYVSSYAGGVYALDPKDGSTRWRFPVEGAGSIVPGDEYIYFSAAKQGLFALDREGRLVWRQALSKGGELSHPIVTAGYVMVSSAARKGGTYVADARTGHLYQFLFPGQGVTSAPSSDGRRVYVLTNLGYFYALEILRPATQIN